MNISKMLREKAANATISPNELFGSKDFQDYFSRIAEGLTEKWGNAPTIRISNDGENGPVAYTDGDVVHLNRTNSLVGKVKGLYKKFLVMLGIGFHELAHIIYLDFDGDHYQLERLEKGELPGAGPFTGEAADELRAALKSRNWQTFFQGLYHRLSNFAADNHDEEALIKANQWASFYGRSSLVERCILTTRQILQAQTSTVEKMLEKTEGKPSLDLMLGMMFQYIRFGYLLVWDPATLDTETAKSLKPFEADLDLISTTDSTVEKYSGITRIVLQLWPIIKDKVQNNDDQSQQSQPQQGNPQNSGDQQQDQSQGGGSGSGSDNKDQGDTSDGQGGGSDADQSEDGSDDQSGKGGSDSKQPKKDGPKKKDGQNAGTSSDPQNQDGQSDGGDQSGQSSAPSLSNASLDDLLDAMNKAAGEQGESSAPKGCSSSSAAKQNQQDDQTGGQDNPTEGGDQGRSSQTQSDEIQSSDGSNGQEDSSEQGQTSKDQSSDGSDDQEDGSEPGQPSDQGDSSDQSDTVKGQVQPKDTEGDTEQDGDGEDDDADGDKSAQDFKNLVDKMKNAKAAEQTEKQLDKERKVEVNAINASGPHSNLRVNVFRVGTPTPRAIESYNRVYAEVSSYSKRLQRLVQQQFEELVMGTTIRHRDFGRDFDVRDAFRPDQKFFTIKKQPDDIPEIVVALLVDLSGSMMGARLAAALKAAVMLYDFCCGLKIPCMICGHNLTQLDNSWNLTIASDFDSVTDQDKYRIMEMRADGCNRDGAAIEVVQGLLAKRPEDHKLCFVLSDGQPNAPGYGDKKAKEDIQSIIAKYRRKGVETFATAIGDDKKQIQEIYGDGYLDIDDLSKLPTTLTKLLKKVILTNI